MNTAIIENIDHFVDLNMTNQTASVFCGDIQMRIVTRKREGKAVQNNTENAFLLARLMNHERFVRSVNGVPMAVMDRTGLEFSMGILEKHDPRLIWCYDDFDSNQQGVLYETERGLRVKFESLI